MIQDQIKNDLKEAMKAKDETRLLVVRQIMSSFTNELVSEGKTPQDEVSDDMALRVIKRLAKQRKDSIEQFKNGGREDLAQKEEAELTILEAYLPEAIGEDELKKIVLAKKDEMGVNDKSKMGMLIGAVMKEVGDRADGTMVKKIIEESF